MSLDKPSFNTSQTVQLEIGGLNCGPPFPTPYAHVLSVCRYEHLNEVRRVASHSDTALASNPGKQEAPSRHMVVACYVRSTGVIMKSYRALSMSTST